MRFLREQCLLLLGAFAECSKKNNANENAGAGIEMQGVPPLYLVEEAASLLGNLYGTYFGSALSQAVGHAMSMGQSLEVLPRTSIMPLENFHEVFSFCEKLLVHWTVQTAMLRTHKTPDFPRDKLSALVLCDAVASKD